MDITMLKDIINNVGFPIVVAVALFWQNFKHHEMYNKTFAEFKEVINHNSNSIEQLTKLVNEVKMTTKGE